MKFYLKKFYNVHIFLSNFIGYKLVFKGICFRNYLIIIKMRLKPLFLTGITIIVLICSANCIKLEN